MNHDTKGLTADEEAYMDSLPEPSTLPPNKLEGPGACMTYRELQAALAERSAKRSK